MWKNVIELIAKIFKAILETFLKHPIDEKNEVYDVGRNEPENPNDAFIDSDW